MLSTEQQIFDQIAKAANILISFANNSDGDGVSGALALFLFLKKMGKNVEIVSTKNADQVVHSTNLSFLPAYSYIKNQTENLRKFIISLDISQAQVNKIKYETDGKTLNFIISPQEGFFTHEQISSRSGGFKYDLVIVLNTPDLESLGEIYNQDTEFFYKTPIINIDHHRENESFGQINLVELTAVSTTEILFSLFDAYSRDLIDEDIATCLLAGLIWKTRSFKTANITPNALLATSKLISLGGRKEEIANNFYRSRELSTLKLWGRVLARLDGTEDGRLVWSHLMPVDFAKTGASENELNEVVEELITNLPRVRIVVLTSKKTNNEQAAMVDVLVYTIGQLNATELICELSPKGSGNLARVSCPAGKDLETEIMVVNLIKSKLDKLSL